jgi:hypothetical protein
MSRVKKKLGSPESLSVAANPSKALGFALFFSENRLFLIIEYQLEAITCLLDDGSSKTERAHVLSMSGKCPGGLWA